MAGGDPSIMRSLGAFFGHIVKAAKHDVTPAAADTPSTTQVHRETSEQHLATPSGPVTLRRTVIEEIDLPANPQPDRRAPVSPPTTDTPP